MTLIEQFNQIYEQGNDEYQKIANGFHQISNLFEKYFRRPNGTEIFGDEAEVNDSNMESEIQPQKLAASYYSPQKRMRESQAADELLARIQILIFIGEHNVPSLTQRIKEYVNLYSNRLIRISLANPRTQSIIMSIRRIYEVYNTSVFDSHEEKMYVNQTINEMLLGQAKILNNFLFDHKENPQQPQPLYTIFTDRTGRHLNLQVLNELDALPG